MNLISSISSQAFDAALALIYPQACALCGTSVESRHDGVVCSRCWAAAPLFLSDETLCWKCGAVSLARVDWDKRDAIRCGRCDDDAFTAARACGLYEGALRASILSLKREPHLPARLARLLYQTQQQQPLVAADLIIPVPLHPSREGERGFNQAVVLARALNRLCSLRLEEHILVRRIQTKMHRVGVDAKARRQSVADAFAVRHSESIVGRHVLLIDDVFTTGATASACSKTLKDAGAAEVLVLTIARALRG
jgi:ComF family protein